MSYPAAGRAKRCAQERIDNFALVGDILRAIATAIAHKTARWSSTPRRPADGASDCRTAVFRPRTPVPAPDRRRPRPTGRYHAGHGGACRAPETKAPRSALPARAVVGAGTGPRVFRGDLPASRRPLTEFPHVASPNSSQGRRREAEMYDAATDRASPTWGGIERNLQGASRTRHRPGPCRSVPALAASRCHRQVSLGLDRGASEGDALGESVRRAVSLTSS